MNHQFKLFVVLFFLTSTSTVLAQNAESVYWQSNGGGCIPTDLTISNQQYWTVTGAGRVKYKGSGTQPLTFSCPVSSFNPNVIPGDGIVLRLFYQDPDGAGNEFSVNARLMSFAKSNGALNQVCVVASDQLGPWQDSIGVCRDIDMDTHLYWVEVVVKRAVSSRSIVEFNGVSLEGRIF